MKKICIFGMICSLLCGVDAMSAVASRSSARVTRTSANQTVSQSVNTNRRAAPRSAVSQNVSSVMPQNDTVNTKISARAATKQKVINTGTKIAGAVNNTMVSEECKTKYYGCMDSFCMLDNTNGGRCLCSDRNAELDKVLMDIQKLDEQSYAMATTGVERIQMGSDADAVQQMVDKISGDVQKESDSNKKSKARTLNLDAWNDALDSDEEDALSMTSTLSGKTGDSLYAAVSDICVKQIPECSANLSMLKMMYTQQVMSDCTAYENSLKQQKSASVKKLQTAQAALREAALEQHQNANKYDLGQCTIRFKQCMQTTADCGDDFSKCASIVASENAQTKVGKKKNTTTYDINTGMTTVSIAASTYDVLLSKKPICDSVTKQCTSVKDQVWETFLRESAAAIKAAELVAESNLRMNCIANISSCFQQACKDNIDPNNPDGSYDMCLSRPETVRSLCKVQIDPCVASEPKILDYVYARLASMRVDSCTTEVKNCLQDDNRCGKDYSNCIGLDLNAIRDMCPLTKLVGCQKNGQDATWKTIDNIVQGIYLNIDNSLLNTCTNLVNAKMEEICGNDSVCMAFDNDDVIGADSLSSYKASNGNFVIEGLLSFGNVKVREVESTSDNVKFGKYELDISGYSDNMKNTDGTSAIKERVLSTLQSTQNKINQKIALLTSDEKISMCVYGRDVKQIRGRESKTDARYPNLLNSSIMSIINAGLEKAETNYTTKYDELLAKVMEEQGDEQKTAMCAAMVSNADGSNHRLNGFKPSLGSVFRVMLKNKSSSDLGGSNTDQNSVDVGMNGSGYDVKLIIDGMTFKQLLSQQSSGKGEYIQTDGSGNMIGKVIMSSVYSSANNVCTITTTTTMCENMKAVYDTKNSVSSSGGAFLFFISDSSSRVSTSTYKGTMCTKMAEPVVKTEEVKM